MVGALPLVWGLQLVAALGGGCLTSGLEASTDSCIGWWPGGCLTSSKASTGSCIGWWVPYLWSGASTELHWVVGALPLVWGLHLAAALGGRCLAAAAAAIAIRPSDLVLDSEAHIQHGRLTIVLILYR